jgi:hypothetical protein
MLGGAVKSDVLSPSQLGPPVTTGSRHDGWRPDGETLFHIRARDFMRIDVSGQVRQMHLPANKALLPLFEAVVNAVEAIAERNTGDGLITITIHREPTLFDDASQDSSLLSDIVGFDVTDNGVGFTDRHFNSFDTSYSTLKADLGGKGVGRLTWLKAFDHAAIDSVYNEAGEWRHRTFQFLPTSRGVEDHAWAPAPTEPLSPRTSVKLIGFRHAYRMVPPKGATPIALRVIEHCLVLYMIDAMPQVIIDDPATSTTIDLGLMYRGQMKYSSSTREFSVGGHTFKIMDALLRPSAESENAIHFCANKRDVESRKLASIIAHAENFIHQNGAELRYAACVTGPYLDAHVNQERTGFNIDHTGELPLEGDAITWEQIQDAAVASATAFLAPLLEEAKQRAVERIERFVTEEEPRYRVLLGHRRAEIEKLSGTITDEKLELELHKILADWRHEVKVEVTRALEGPPDADSFERFEREAAGVLEHLGEVVKSDLAAYVVHRRTVLDFLARMLGLIGSGKFAREEVLHGLFFPTRTTSSEVDYDKHNLWVLDERLAFHKFLASDVAFSRQTHAPVRIEGDGRPDILIYNHPIAFAESTEDTSSVVIVEFKRPEREDYAGEDNPFDQVLDYVAQISAGQAVRGDGSRVDRPRDGTPFFCYVVVTITPKLRELALRRGYHVMPDGDGFFSFNENYKAYIEVVNYRKVLNDAVKRNKAFFDKLGLHTGASRPQH